METQEVLLGPGTVSRIYLASAFDLEWNEQAIRLPSVTALVMQTSRPLLGGQLQPVPRDESCGRVVITEARTVEIAFDAGTRIWVDCAAPQHSGISYGKRGVLIVHTPARQFSLWFAPGAKPRKHARVAAAEALESVGYNRAQ